MTQVLVVPETENFKLDVTYNEVVYININLGVPQLIQRNAKYLGIYWLTDDFEGVNRIYQILDSPSIFDKCTEIRLGNSYILANTWHNMSQHRRFEYHNLEEFGLKEVANGILLPFTSKKNNLMTDYWNVISDKTRDLLHQSVDQSRNEWD